MANPTSGDVHVNIPLTNISIAYIQSATNFVADKVFPIVPVTKQSDVYFTYDRDDWFRDEAQERAPGSETAGSGWDLDATHQYFCRVIGHHKDIADQMRANADSPLDPDRDATQFVTQKLLLKREINWVANFMATGKWATDIQGKASSPTPGTECLKWSVYDSTNKSNPPLDVANAASKIGEATGFVPNVMVVSADVFNVLKEHPVILDRVKYTQRAVITEEILAGVFGVEKFLVARGVVNTSPKGKAASNSYIASKKALLVYAEPAPSLLKPSGGYIFSWTGYLGAGRDGTRIKKFRMENLASDRIEGEMAQDPHMIAKDLGVLFYDIV